MKRTEERMKKLLFVFLIVPLFLIYGHYKITQPLREAIGKKQQEIDTRDKKINEIKKTLNTLPKSELQKRDSLQHNIYKLEIEKVMLTSFMIPDKLILNLGITGLIKTVLDGEKKTNNLLNKFYIKEQQKISLKNCPPDFANTYKKVYENGLFDNSRREEMRELLKKYQVDRSVFKL